MSSDRRDASEPRENSDDSASDGHAALAPQRGRARDPAAHHLPAREKDAERDHPREEDHEIDRNDCRRNQREKQRPAARKPPAMRSIVARRTASGRWALLPCLGTGRFFSVTIPPPASYHSTRAYRTSRAPPGPFARRALLTTSAAHDCNRHPRCVARSAHFRQGRKEPAESLRGEPKSSARRRHSRRSLRFSRGSRRRMRTRRR